ncbi:GntR family transcriptional regulator [Clostridium sp. AN503]|uniref:GntR family transcriptional regulator n=1 Tax=Clostridium sp. AN503 TaxID=3160598 RepID=UPI00345895B3
MSEITRDTAVPLYLQIADDIKSKIESGEVKANSRIPTEHELSEAYKVSRITIRKALELLVDEEILVRKQRIGTFVSDKKVTRSLNAFMGFSQSCEMQGNKAGTQFLSAELVKARPSDLKRLEIEDDDKLIRIRRLRFCNDVPVILEENHFPKEFAFLLAEDLNGSLHEILLRHGIVLTRGSKTIGVCYATREEAKHLGVKENDALIMSKDVAYDTSGRAVYSGKEIINADRYEYKILTNSMGKTE